MLARFMFVVTHLAWRGGHCEHWGLYRYHVLLSYELFYCTLYIHGMSCTYILKTSFWPRLRTRRILKCWSLFKVSVRHKYIYSLKEKVLVPFLPYMSFEIRFVFLISLLCKRQKKSVSYTIRGMTVLSIWSIGLATLIYFSGSTFIMFFWIAERSYGLTDGI